MIKRGFPWERHREGGVEAGWSWKAGIFHPHALHNIERSYIKFKLSVPDKSITKKYQSKFIRVLQLHSNAAQRLKGNPIPLPGMPNTG
jgi:hypothetical protein